jgi:Arc/MetJ family transcription regulator
MRRAMEVSGKTTKKAVVEDALRLVVQLKRQEEIRSLFGKVRWEGDLNEMREGRFLDWDDRPARETGAPDASAA